jgi:hypothetical protein
VSRAIVLEVGPITDVLKDVRELLEIHGRGVRVDGLAGVAALAAFGIT